MFHNGISTCLLNDSDMDPMDEIMQPARAAKVVNKVGEESYLTSSWLCSCRRAKLEDESDEPRSLRQYFLLPSTIPSQICRSRDGRWRGWKYTTPRRTRGSMEQRG